MKSAKFTLVLLRVAIDVVKVQPGGGFIRLLSCAQITVEILARVSSSHLNQAQEVSESLLVSRQRNVEALGTGRVAKAVFDLASDTEGFCDVRDVMERKLAKDGEKVAPILPFVTWKVNTVGDLKRIGQRAAIYSEYPW